MYNELVKYPHLPDVILIIRFLGRQNCYNRIHIRIPYLITLTSDPFFNMPFVQVYVDEEGEKHCRAMFHFRYFRF